MKTKEEIRKRNEANHRRISEMNRQFVRSYKRDKCCVLCGWKEHTNILQFHHIDKDDKDFPLGKGIKAYKTETIKEEMDKCILLCPNCHMWHHHKEREEIRRVRDEN